MENHLRGKKYVLKSINGYTVAGSEAKNCAVYGCTPDKAKATRYTYKQAQKEAIAFNSILPPDEVTRVGYDIEEA